MSASQSISWDAHSCVPLSPSYRLDSLRRHRDAGFDYVSINVGMDANPVDQIKDMIARFREQIERLPDLRFADSLDDVHRAATDGTLAVSFDLEGAVPLASDPANVSAFHELGVRQMHFAYNRRNDVAGGCYEPDAPLTKLGHEVLQACEEAGVIVDCSHLNERSALAILEAAKKPTVFSHSNVRSLNSNFRNITDRMITACAATGGVIGVTGLSNFTPGERAEADAMIEVIDYLSERVDCRHIGIGLDYVYDVELDELPDGCDPTYWWPLEYGYGEDFYKSSKFVPPEAAPQLRQGLQARGYADDDIDGIMGGNFYRVANACW
jgi:membrane dipeptidase